MARCQPAGPERGEHHEHRRDVDGGRARRRRQAAADDLGDPTTADADVADGTLDVLLWHQVDASSRSAETFRDTRRMPFTPARRRICSTRRGPGIRAPAVNGCALGANDSPLVFHNTRGMPLTPPSSGRSTRALSIPGVTLPELVSAPVHTGGDRRDTPVKRRIANGAAVAAFVAGLLAVAASNAAASSGKAATAAREIVVARLVFSESVLTGALPATYELTGGLRGEANGRLTSRLVSLAGSNAGFRVTFDWVVSSPRGSFTARTAGTWNPETGRIVMSGRVGDGYLGGAELYAQGRIFDPGRPTFEGSLRVVRDTAGMARLQRHADEQGRQSSALLDRVGLRRGDRAIDFGCGLRGVLEL
jgi:hypothetical protein